MIITSRVKLRIRTDTSCTLQKRWKKLMQQTAIHWTRLGLRTDGLSSSQPHQDPATNCGTESKGTPSAIPHLLTSIIHTCNTVIRVVSRSGSRVESKCSERPRKQRGKKKKRKEYALHMLTVQKSREHTEMLFPMEIFLSLT